MLRILIITTLAVILAGRHLDRPADEITGWAITTAMLLWLTWPLLARLTRLALRHKSRRQPGRPAQQPALHIPRQPTALTQVNHYHYYKPAPAAVRPQEPPHLQLPQLGLQQVLHNQIYDR